MTEESGQGSMGEGGNFADLKTKIDNFIAAVAAESIGNELADFTSRMRNACDELEQGPARLNVDTGDPDRQLNPWIHADVYRILSVESFVAMARDAYRKIRSSVVTRLELARNIVIFIPILLTWAALSHASNAYAAAAQHDPSLYYVPFLSQWETYFSGYMKPFLGFIPMQFSAIAFYDVVFITLIIALTLAMHFIGDQWHEGKEQKITELAGQLEQIQWDLVVAINWQKDEYYENAEQRSYAVLRKIDRFVAEFRNQGLQTLHQFQEQGLQTLRQFQEQGSQMLDALARQGQAQHTDLVEQSNDLLNRMAAEQHRLIDWAESLRDNFKETGRISADFRAGMESLNHVAPALEKSLNGFASSAKVLAEEAGELKGHEARLADSLQSLDGHLNEFEEVINVLSKDLGGSADTVANAAFGYGDKLTAINTLVQDLAKAIREIAGGQTKLQDTLIAGNAMTFVWADNIQRSTQSIAESQQSIGRYAERLDALAAVFKDFEADEQRLTERIDTMGSYLRDVKTELVAYREVIGTLLAAAGDARARESEVAQRVSVLSSQLAPIGTGLESVREAIGKLSEHESRILSVSADVASLSGSNNEVSLQLRQLSEAIAGLQTDLSHWRNVSQDWVTSAQRSMDQVNELAHRLDESAQVQSSLAPEIRAVVDAAQDSVTSNHRLVEEMVSLRMALPELAVRRDGDDADKMAE